MDPMDPAAASAKPCPRSEQPAEHRAGVVDRFRICVARLQAQPERAEFLRHAASARSDNVECDPLVMIDLGPESSDRMSGRIELREWRESRIGPP